MAAHETGGEVDTVRMWEIARYVEAHPENHEQRWRLAKKLYASWEYRLALEHLLILKDEWQRKVNVHRYLAATLYRLGLYVEAERALEEAIEYWPKDVGLREQLARVMETAGKRDEAAGMWESIREIQPTHPMAESAVRRLKRKTEASASEDLNIGASDSGIDLSPGQVCPNCGAHNGEEFDRCWQCHASLYGVSSQRNSTPSITRRRQTAFGLDMETVRVISGLTAVGILTMALYLSLRLILAWRQADSEPVIQSLDHLYSHHLGLSRVVSGSATILFAPLLLSLSIGLARPERTASRSLQTLAALIAAGLIYLSSWLPPYLWPIAMGACVVFLGGVLCLGLKMRLQKAVGAVALNTLFVCLLSTAVFSLLEFIQTGVPFNPVTDSIALAQYAQNEDPSEENRVTLSATPTPVRLEGITWDSTHSAWLDRRAGSTLLSLSMPIFESGTRFILQKESVTVLDDPIIESHFSGMVPMEPGMPYTILVEGKEGVPVTVSAQGLLRPVLPAP